MSKSKKSKTSNAARRAQLIENKYRRKIYGIVAVVTVLMMLAIAALFHQYRIVKKYEHAVALVEDGVSHDISSIFELINM